MGENGTGAKDDPVHPENQASTAEETGLVLDDQLRSAATPFLWLLSSLLIALAAYFLYTLLRG